MCGAGRQRVSMNKIQLKILKSVNDLTNKQAVHNLLVALEVVIRDTESSEVCRVVSPLLKDMALNLDIRGEMFLEKELEKL